MNSPIICETCTRDFTDECDDRSSFDEIGKVICMECFAKEDDRDGICEGCNENAGEECSNCDNIACSECIEEFTTDENDKRCRICADDEPDSEEEEEEELKKTRFRPQTRMGECEGCIGICEECEPLVVCEEEEEEDLDQYDFECCGIKRIYKVVMNVAGGGMMNGNAYANVEGEWACEDDFVNGEDGEIHYCEYGPNPVREWRGVRLRYSDDGNLFKIEE